MAVLRVPVDHTSPVMALRKASLFRFQNAFCSGRKTLKRRSGPDRSFFQLAAAIGADAGVGAFCARRTECAFEGTNKGARLVGWQIGIAGFAIGSHLEHTGSYPPKEKGATRVAPLSFEF